jgi:hypothetical protein
MHIVHSKNGRNPNKRYFVKFINIRPNQLPVNPSFRKRLQIAKKARNAWAF